MRKYIGAVLGVWVILAHWTFPATAGPETPFSPERAGFSVRFGEEESPYRVMAMFVLPGEALAVEAVDRGAGDGYELRAQAGTVAENGPGAWRWTAPGEKGLYTLEVANLRSGEAVRLHVFVMVPYREMKKGHLNGYRIDAYPEFPLRGLAIYDPPLGFIEVTPENEDTRVSPHFMLKQFLCKQDGGYPKYLVLRERLLLKLELILQRANEAGFRCDTFVVMSGYRTPYYNRAIGNVKYSRHVWGGAADIYIDANPADGMMDDLNRDRKIDRNDAAVLYDLVDTMYGKAWYAPFVGGLGRYEKTSARGPFVHVDVRGTRARWGN